jgi:hypothetical protein
MLPVQPGDRRRQCVWNAGCFLVFCVPVSGTSASVYHFLSALRKGAGGYGILKETVFGYPAENREGYEPATNHFPFIYALAVG